MKKYFPLILIIIVACILRFTYLDRISNAMNGDELLYAITAKSVFLTGHDITGTWNPLSLFIFRSPPNETAAELPYILQLTVSAFPFSLLLARLPFAILSVGIVLLLYLISRELFGENVAVATGLIAAINPWLVVMGRTGYETTPATFFYLAGFYTLLKFRSWKVLWSLVPFILAFYSYIGTKLIFVPFIFLAAFVSAHSRKAKSRKPYIVLCAITILFVVIYVTLLRTNPEGSRLSEVLLPNSPVVASQVDAVRKFSLASPFIPVITNKYTQYLQILSSKLLDIFSPKYLFVNGDQFFLPISQSFFYYIDSIFMVLGTLVLFSRKRLYAICILLFALIGSLPHVFHKTMTDYSTHLTLMFPFLILLIGAGVAEIVQSFSKRFRTVALLVVILLYIFNLGGLVGNYFIEHPIAGGSDFRMRVLSRYMTLAKKSGSPITFYTTRKGDFLKKYLFYTNGMNPRTISDISHINTNQPFNFDGIHFTDCDAKASEIPPGTVAIFDTTCDIKLNGPTRHISRLSDGGVLYNIVNDQVCNGMTLNAYPTGITLDDMSVEKLPLPRFCNAYISQ